MNNLNLSVCVNVKLDMHFQFSTHNMTCNYFIVFNFHTDRDFAYILQKSQKDPCSFLLGENDKIFG